MVKLYSLDQEMFFVIFALFTRKWIEEYPYLGDDGQNSLKSEVREIMRYISDVWVHDRSVCNWFEGACPLVPATNNSLESNNASFKKNYTGFKRHSINVLTDKIGQYLNDQADMKKEEDETKTPDAAHKSAEKFLNRNGDFFVSKVKFSTIA